MRFVGGGFGRGDRRGDCRKGSLCLTATGIRNPGWRRGFEGGDILQICYLVVLHAGYYSALALEQRSNWLSSELCYCQAA